MGQAAAASLGPAGQLYGIIEGNAAGEDQARAGRAAGDAELLNQQRQRSETLKYAAPTDFEISRMGDALQVSQRDLQRREQILASADPALLEAGKQALQLLRGDKEAGSLSVLRKQRERQRTKLVDQLKQRLGPGAEQSSAGIQALTAFDSATDDALQNAQSAETQNFLGLAERNASNFNTNQNFQQLMGLQQAQRGIQQSQANASMNTGITGLGGAIQQDYMNANNRAKSGAATGSFISGLGGGGGSSEKDDAILNFTQLFTGKK